MVMNFIILRKQVDLWGILQHFHIILKQCRMHACVLNFKLIQINYYGDECNNTATSKERTYKAILQKVQYHVTEFVKYAEMLNKLIPINYNGDECNNTAASKERTYRQNDTAKSMSRNSLSILKC